jgi:hypothetical protein
MECADIDFFLRKKKQGKEWKEKERRKETVSRRQ